MIHGVFSIIVVSLEKFLDDGRCTFETQYFLKIIL